MRFARVTSLHASKSSVLNVGGSTKDTNNTSDESSSEDDIDAIEREKKLAALQQQVTDH